MGTHHRTGLTDVQHGRSRRWSPLLAPLRYLRIAAPGKWRYDYVLPGAVASALLLVYWLLDPHPAVFGPTGFLTGIASLLSVAVPFLIGALATIAMASPIPNLDTRPAGAPIQLDGVTLTVRQFVCYLLGYLSFIGFLLLIGIIVANSIQPSVSAMLSGYADYVTPLKAVLLAALFTVIASFVLTTFWALYFLTDVVNRR